MFTEKDFAERYKSYSNSELLEILDNPKSYQLIALKVARQELNARDLSDSEINEAREELLFLKEKADKIVMQNALLKEQLINKGVNVAEAFSPIQKIIPTANKLIFLVGIVYTILLIFLLKENWSIIKYLIAGELKEEFAFTQLIFPLLILLVGIILFWAKMKPGWILLVVYISYCIVLCLINGYFAFSSHFGNQESFFPYPSPTSYILALLFFLGAILTLIRNDVSVIFNIKPNDKIGSIISGIIIGLIIFMLTY